MTQRLKTILVCFIGLTIAGPASSQANFRQELRTSDQRIPPSQRSRQACRTFKRGERIDDQEMREWRSDPACADQVRAYDKKHDQSR